MSGKSRIEKILENLLGENNVIEPPIGRDEKILYSILNDLEYTEPPHSIFEELLLAIKNNSPLETEYDYNYLTRDEKILFCKLNRREYFEPPHSRLEKLLIKWLYLDLYLNIDGIPPFTFISNGSPIIDYTIYGNKETSGTPTPQSPVMPQGCGELETVGAKAGQYKISISSANTTTPVYLGEVETTRKIKKLVLDGTEKWYTAVSSTGLFGIQRFEPMHAHPFIPGYSAISNCYVYNPVQSGIDAATVSGEFALQAFRVGSTWQYNFFIKDGRYNNLNSFISYLAAQYATGTPVTVWYVLATEETGIVNEPLMKIGDYTDEINYEQTAVSIPTVSGRNTFDVLGDVKPSNVEITYAPRAPLLRTRKTVLKK